MTPLFPAIAGALVAAGLLALFVGVRPSPPSAPTRMRRRTRCAWSKRSLTLVAVALAAGLVGWLITGWMLSFVLAPVAIVGIPMLLQRSPAQRQIERLEALEVWTRALAGVLTVGVGLEQALVATLRSTPAPISPQVRRLVTRIRARWDTEAALRAFASELHDSTADAIVMNLILGARRRGAGLASVLEASAESVAADVRDRGEIEADREKHRSTARWVTIISLSVLGILAISGTYVAPYRTTFGQFLLLILIAAYAAQLAWMRKIANGKPRPRLLSHTPVRRGAR